MLIRTCLKAHIIALHSLESGNGICQHDLVGVSNVRLAGSVSNGRCDVIRFSSWCFSHFSAAKAVCFFTVMLFVQPEFTKGWKMQHRYNL